MSHIFISYSHDDSEYANKLARKLEDEGFEVWIDGRIDYGSAWPKVIRENLDSCAAFAVIMTSRSKGSTWVKNELSRAQAKRKPIFPLLLEGEVWLQVQAIQYVAVSSGQLPSTDFYTDLAQVAPYKQTIMLQFEI